MSQFFKPEALAIFAEAQKLVDQITTMLAPANVSFRPPSYPRPLLSEEVKLDELDFDDRYMRNKYSDVFSKLLDCWFELKSLKDYVNVRYLPKETNR